jgi:hypothetical protein
MALTLRVTSVTNLSEEAHCIALPENRKYRGQSIVSAHPKESG